MPKFNPWGREQVNIPTARVEVTDPESGDVFKVTLRKPRIGDVMGAKVEGIRLIGTYLPRERWTQDHGIEAQGLDFPPVGGKIVELCESDLVMAAALSASIVGEDLYTPEELIALSRVWPDAYDELALAYTKLMGEANPDPKAQSASSLKLSVSTPERVTRASSGRKSKR